MIGTTQFVNALVQGTQLSKVFVIRLCGTSSMALPPFLGIPPELLQQIAGGYLLADGAPGMPPRSSASHRHKAQQQQHLPQ
jgi:hypothetical protein